MEEGMKRIRVSVDRHCVKHWVEDTDYRYPEWRRVSDCTIDYVEEIEEDDPRRGDCFFIEQDAKICYIVCNFYRDGDTFGYHEGQLQIVDVFANEEDAMSLKQAIEDFDGNRIGGLDHNVEHYYLHGGGYFGYREDVQVVCERILPMEPV